jgi:two-component system LytT family response regulator
MITAIIVEDELSGIENLILLLNKFCPQVKIIGSARTAREGKEIILEKKPQLVFLDIEMPYGNGFDLLQSFDSIDFEVIFVTAFDKYALKAIKSSAIDYLLKPIDIEELIKAVNKAYININQKQEKERINTLLQNLGPKKLEKIALPTGNGMLFIKTSDVIRCEAEGGYTWFYLTNRPKILTTRNLGEYEELLESNDFLRVHHQHLVNFEHIAEYRKGTSPVLIMSDGAEITVSFRKKDALMEKLNKLN